MRSIALVFPKSTFLETALAFPPLGLFYIASRLESLCPSCLKIENRHPHSKSYKNWRQNGLLVAILI